MARDNVLLVVIKKSERGDFLTREQSEAELRALVL